MCFQWVVCFIFFSQLYSTCALASQRTCENCESGIFWEPRTSIDKNVKGKDPKISLANSMDPVFSICPQTSWLIPPIPEVFNGTEHHLIGECEKPNMIWDRCRGHCPITCKGLTSGGDICLYVCLPGCICQQGFYLRKDTNECVKEEDCPTKE